MRSSPLMEKADIGTKSNLKDTPMTGSMGNMWMWNNGEP